MLLRGYINRDNTPINIPLSVLLEDGTEKQFATQQCLAIVFRHAHFDLGMSGAPLLDVRTGMVMGMVQGVLTSSFSPTHQPLGFSIPLTDVAIVWKDFADECNVLDYEPLLDDEIVPQAKEFLRHQSFTDRPQLMKHVDDFLNDPDRKSGYLLLVAGEGEGKSAFMAHRVQNRIEPVSHFLRRTEPGWDDPVRMLRSLSAQLLRKWGVGHNQELRDRLEEADGEGQRMKAASAYFADVLERVSRVAASEGQREVIWIDGLDEAFGPTGNYHDEPGLPGLIPAHLPPGICAVLTSRPGDHLHWLRDPKLCTRHRIEDERQQNIEDVLAYIASQALTVTPPLTADFIRRAAERIKGNFYIAVQKMEEIKRDPAASRDPETIPQSVNEYHAEVYTRVASRDRRDGIGEKDVRFVLGLMAEAREPLSPEQLEAFNAPEFAEQVLALAADYFSQRPLHRAPDLPYEFNHTSVQEFLSQQLTRKERQEIHARIADGCLNWRDTIETARLYALRHLPTHLREAGDFERLADILTNYPFLQTKLDHCGVFDLLADYRESISALPQHMSGGRDTVGNFFRIIERYSHLIKERPKVLYQAVFNALQAEGSSALKKWSHFSSAYVIFDNDNL